MSVITIHSVDPNGKHTVAAFQNVSITQRNDSPRGGAWIDPAICRTPLIVENSYEIRGADGYEVHEGGTLEDAYMSLLQSQAQKIAVLEQDKRHLLKEVGQFSARLDDIKDQIRIAIGDKEEPEEEDW